MVSKQLSPEARIINAFKHLDLTLEEVKAEMDRNHGNLEWNLRIPRLRGSLRLVIRCRHSSPAAWSMSVILNSNRFDGRIACIDWEPLFASIDGMKCSGFHRHVWNEKAMSCDRDKVALDQFNPTSLEEFILQGLELFRVVLGQGGIG